MRKTTPGADRITMTALRAQVASHRKAIAVHLQHCAHCNIAEKDAYLHCREWWRIKMALHADQQKLTALEIPENPQQERLFND